MTTLCDIVITCYNRKHVIQQAIESAQASALGHIIIVDDCSKDGSYEWLQAQYGEADDMSLYQTPKNLGVSGAKNFGFVHSSAPWVLFLDSDDSLIVEEVPHIRQTMATQSQTPILFFRCLDKATNTLVGTPLKNAQTIDLKTFVHHTTFGETLAIFNKKLSAHPPYDADLRGYEGIGCARRIEKFGPAYLSDKAVRTYDQSGEDRLSSPTIFKKRAALLAKGHLRFYREFKHAMSLGLQIRYITKILIYSFFSLFIKTQATK